MTTGPELCDKLGIQESELDQLVASGMPHFEGTFNEGEVLQWLMEEGFVKSDKPSIIIRSVYRAATAVGVSPTTFLTLVDKPDFPESCYHGHWVIDDIRAWLKAHRENNKQQSLKIADGTDPDVADDPDRRWKRARAETLEVELKKKKDELISVDEGDRLIRLITNMKQHFLAFPSQLYQAMLTAGLEEARASEAKRIADNLIRRMMQAQAASLKQAALGQEAEEDEEEFYDSVDVEPGSENDTEPAVGDVDAS